MGVWVGVTWPLHLPSSRPPNPVDLVCWAPRDRHDKNMRDVKGLDFYQKSKDMTDNIVFWTYMEWDTFGNMMDHCE